MTMHPYRFYVRSPDGHAIYGFGRSEAAEVAALEYGEGAHVINTLAKNYQPMLSEVIGGELLVSGISGWDTGKPGGLNHDFVEAAKKHASLAHAFLEKGADVNACDKNGGPALHWAVGAGKADIVILLIEKGADINARDAHGQSALELAEKKGHKDITGILRAAP